MTEFRVGLFTLAALAAFGIASLKITANKAIFGDYKQYRGIVKDASGIFPRTSIKVAGINAGQIEKIGLKGDAAELVFKLKSEIPLTENSYMRIKTVGFLGEKYIDVVVGEPSELELVVDGYIKVQGGAGFEDLAKDASEIMADVKEIMKKVREGVENETSKNVIREILENVNEISASLRRTVGSNEEKLNNIIASVEELAQQLAYETNGKNQDSLMNGLKKLTPILDDLKEASSDIKVIIADVKAGKGTVGKLLRDEETVDRVNETLSSVNRLMGRINNLQAEISVYSGYNNKFDGSTQLEIDLYTAPERFFRIGAIVNDFYYITEETESSSTGTSGATNNVTRTTNKDEFKFNFQMGRKIQDFSFRIGLFESKGGVGVDYDISSWNTKLSADLFNFDRDDQPAFLRLSSEIRIWNVLYSKFVLEDVLSDNLSYTVYGGLRFTDDDIASLISILAR